MALSWKPNESASKGWNGTLTDAHFTAVKKLLNKLDATKIAGNSGTILSEGEWRIDLQDPPPNAYNVQVQRNGAPNPSTIAGVIVPLRLATAIGAGGNEHAKRRAEVLRYAVHGALIQSAATLRVKLNDKGAVVIGGGKVITMQTIVGQYDI